MASPKSPSSARPRSLEIFLAGLLDYAGTFPPAKLPLEDAVTVLLNARDHPFGALVGNFICAPSSLAALAQRLGNAQPQRVSILIAPLSHDKTSLEMLELELRALAGQAAAHRDRIRVLALEVSLADDDFYHSDQVFAAHFLRRFVRLAAELFESGISCYFEPKRSAIAGGPSFEKGVLPLLFTLRTLRAETSGITSSGSLVDIGVKWRTGGVTKEAFPDVAELAGALTACVDFGLPVKATAGLHRPLRYFDAELNCHHHGFLNVFTAAILAKTHVLAIADVESILACEDPAQFHFTDEGLEYGKRWRLGLRDIYHARQVTARGFGSCSFAEAVETLATQGFI